MLGAIKMKLLKSCCGCICIFFGGIIILFLGLYVYDKWIWEEWPIERIEQVSGIRVPSYKIIETYKGKRSFTGDYEDRFNIKFKTMPSEELFDKIDQMIASGNTGWQRDGKNYSFSVIWGNGLPAPKGESEEHDGTFSITIIRGEDVGEIRSGVW
jgi:hypothetical protein